METRNSIDRDSMEVGRAIPAEFHKLLRSGSDWAGGLPGDSRWAGGHQ